MKEQRLGIEEKIEHLEFNNTKAYFSEAYNCYINGNYRAAVVSLWSVLVCDAVYKLKKMAGVYDDKWAIKKLESIEALQKSNSTSSEWEISLLESFYIEKKFIGVADITSIRDIQKRRHLCAHPILSEDSTLFSPGKDLVKSLLISALDNFLLKQSYYNKDVFSLIAETLEENNEYYANAKNVEKLILEYSYRTTDYALFEIFKSFWRITFYSDNERCIKNRDLNSKACVCLFDLIMNKPVLAAKLDDEREYFDKFSLDFDSLRHLFVFLSARKTMFKIFSSHKKDLLASYREKDFEGKDDIYVFKLASLFFHENADDYFADINVRIKRREVMFIDANFIGFVQRRFEDMDINREIVALLLNYAGASSTYAEADERMKIILDGHLDLFLIDDIQKLIEIAKGNSQIRNRGRNDRDMQKLINKIEELKNKTMAYHSN